MHSAEVALLVFPLDKAGQPPNAGDQNDNRDKSDDSRMDVGYVPAEDLVGKAEFRFFSIDESAVWYEPWTWPGAIRFSRMFTPID